MISNSPPPGFFWIGNATMTTFRAGGPTAHIHSSVDILMKRRGFLNLTCGAALMLAMNFPIPRFNFDKPVAPFYLTVKTKDGQIGLLCESDTPFRLEEMFDGYKMAKEYFNLNPDEIEHIMVMDVDYSYLYHKY